MYMPLKFVPGHDETGKEEDKEWKFEKDKLQKEKEEIKWALYSFILGPSPWEGEGQKWWYGRSRGIL